MPIHINAQRQPEGPDIYVGFSGGINFTQPVVLNEFNLISSMTGEEGNFFTKDYDILFKNSGTQFHFTFWYPLTEEFHAGLNPGLATYKYSYTTEAFWNDPFSPESEINLTYRHKHKLRYIELPLTLRYVFRFEHISPYIQAGGLYSSLIAADKHVAAELMQNTASGELPINSQGNGGDVYNSYIRSRLALFGGAGAAFDLKSVVLTLDMNYYIGLNNIINESARFSDASFSGTNYDLQDDLKLNHLIFNLAILFPINQITNRGSLDCIYFK